MVGLGGMLLHGGDQSVLLGFFYLEESLGKSKRTIILGQMDELLQEGRQVLGLRFVHVGQFHGDLFGDAVL